MHLIYIALKEKKKKKAPKEYVRNNMLSFSCVGAKAIGER